MTPPAQPQPKKPGCALLIIVAIAAALVIAVASTSDDTDTTADAKAPTVITTGPGLTDTDIGRIAMLSSIRAEYPDWKKVSDDRIVSLGQTACNALRTGNSITAVGTTIANSMDIGMREAGYVLGAMITALCPEQRPATDNT